MEDKRPHERSAYNAPNKTMRNIIHRPVVHLPQTSSSVASVTLAISSFVSGKLLKALVSGADLAIPEEVREEVKNDWPLCYRYVSVKLYE